MTSYEKRLADMYNSDEFRAHNIYPSTNVSFVYAVISMCLELKTRQILIDSREVL